MICNDVSFKANRDCIVKTLTLMSWCSRRFTCKHLGRGRVGDGGGILRNGAHVGLRGAAGRRDRQRCHHHPGFELQKKKKKKLSHCLFQAYHVFTKSCMGGGGGVE